MQVRVVVTVVYATEVVQKQVECAGKEIQETQDVFVQKADGVVQVGVQLVQLVGAVFQ